MGCWGSRGHGKGCLCTCSLPPHPRQPHTYAPKRSPCSSHCQALSMSSPWAEETKRNEGFWVRCLTLEEGRGRKQRPESLGLAGSKSPMGLVDVPAGTAQEGRWCGTHSRGAQLLSVEKPLSQLQPRWNEILWKQNITKGKHLSPRPQVVHRCRHLQSCPGDLSAFPQPHPNSYRGSRESPQVWLAPRFSSHLARWPMVPVGLHSGMAPEHALLKKTVPEIKVRFKH